MTWGVHKRRALDPRTAPTRVYRKKPTEHDHQSAYFDLVRLHMPNCKLIYAVPNAQLAGKYLIVRHLQAEGLTSGVPDVNIDYARGGYNGMRIEFKRDEKQEPSDEQIEAHKQLRREGYLVEVHHDPEQAWARTRQYLRGEIVREFARAEAGE